MDPLQPAVGRKGVEVGSNGDLGDSKEPAEVRDAHELALADEGQHATAAKRRGDVLHKHQLTITSDCLSRRKSKAFVLTNIPKQS